MTEPPLVAVDTSVAIPLIASSHVAHIAVRAWWHGRRLALSGHAAAETYSVLTRLPGDARLTPADAVHLLALRFATTLHPSPGTTTNLLQRLAAMDITGGAVYDAMVALAAVDNSVPLATRDGRAKATYERVGVHLIIVA